MELTPFFVFLLVLTGFIAGIINTMAGGGSNLTLPALMVMGLPADVANATNRVGVMMQSLVAMRGFISHGKMPTQDLPAILWPIGIGGLVGALSASFFPEAYLKPILLLTMISMSVVILVKPSTVIPSTSEAAIAVSSSRSAFWMLVFAGWYGGFVQAGVGFILIAAIAGGLRYDLVRTNALKVLATGAFTAVALVVFIWQDQVMWLPGAVLAASTMLGAHIGVKWALRVSQRFMKWFLFVMTVAASLAAVM